MENLTVVLEANIDKFQSALNQAEKGLQGFAKNAERLQGIGKSISMYVTAPLSIMGGVAVAAWDKQVKAMAQVENGLRSTGNAAGLTMDQLTKAASDLQSKTLFGDEDILQKATAQLLTFTNITQDRFLRTQTVAADLASKLGGDLQSAAIQLGKALNDPVANLSALSRSGIQFSAEQKTLIDTLAKTGRLAEAQTVILDELEKQYGGTAAAAAKAGTGGLVQLQNSIGDLMEEVGGILYQGIVPMVDGMKDLVTSFQDLSPEVKKTVVIVAAAAAAMGPLLVAIGSIGAALPMIGAGFAALTGPIGLTVVAIGAAVTAIIANWDTIKAYFTTGGGADVFNKVKEVAVKSFEIIKAALRVFVGVASKLWDTFGGVILGHAKYAWDNIKGVVSGTLDIILAVLDIFTNLWEGNWSGLWESVVNYAKVAANTIIDIIAGVATAIPRILNATFKGLGIDNAITRSLDQSLEAVKEFVENVKFDTKDLASSFADAFVITAPDRGSTTNEDSASTPLADNSQLEKTSEILKKLQEEFNLASKQFIVFGDSYDVVKEKAGIFENAIVSLLANGISPQSKLIQDLKAEFDNLNTTDLTLLKSTWSCYL